MAPWPGPAARRLSSATRSCGCAKIRSAWPRAPTPRTPPWSAARSHWRSRKAMLGSLILGTLTPGQPTTQRFVALGSAAAIGIETSAPLLAGAALSASAPLAISTPPPILAPGPLFGNAAISVSAEAPLALFGPLAGAAALSISAANPQIIVSGPLQANTAVALSVSPAPLKVGAISMAAEAICSVIALVNRLSTVPATFSATATMSTIAVGNLEKIGASAFEAVVAFNGGLTNAVRLNTLMVRWELNDRPDTCNFIVDTAPPPVGTDVKIGLRNVLAENLLFAGTVINVAQNYLGGDATKPSWAVASRGTFLIKRGKG